MNSLSFQPLLPNSAWLILAAAAAAMLIWYAARRPAEISAARWSAVIFLMSAATALVLILLLNPTWTHQLDSPSGKPVLTILVDSSRSMSTPDAAPPSTSTRYSAAAVYAKSLNADLLNQFDVHLKCFDSTIRDIDTPSLSAAAPAGPSTDLAAAIDSALDVDQPHGQAIVLLSDGIPSVDGGASRVLQSARVARAMESPVYTHIFGQTGNQAHIGIEVSSEQDVLLPSQKMLLTANITSAFTRGSTTATLYLNGAEVDHADVLLDPTGRTPVSFPISHDKTGIYSYELRVRPTPGQTALADTSAAFTLRVIDQPICILVLEGKPYWDSKFFTRTLAAGPAVALDTVTRISDSRIMYRSIARAVRPTTNPTTQPDPADDLVDTWKIAQDPREPLANLDNLRKYQVIVLGRNVDAFLDDNAVANLQTWVSQSGGSLVCYRGDPTERPDARLSKLMPVEWTAVSSPSRFRIQLTDQGRDLNWLASPTDDPLPRLPSLSASDTAAVSKPLAVVLAGAPSADGPAASPVLVYHPYGTGKVIAIQGAGMWRWAFLPPQFQNQELVYANLWQSMMRWLTSDNTLHPGQMQRLRADQPRFATDEAATATLLIRQEGTAGKSPQVQITSTTSATPSTPGQFKPESFTPTPIGAQAGVYRVDFGKLPAGQYSAHVLGAPDDDLSARIIFDVIEYDQETMNLQPRPDLMARIASDSGGASLPDANASDFLTTNFTRAYVHSHPPRLSQEPAWDRWWILAIALGLWMSAWTTRRAGGLI